jgi:ion channel
MDQIAILIPLVVGFTATLLTIVVHALALVTIIHFVRYERKVGRAGTGFAINVAIVAVAVVLALAAHLIEMAIWAAVFAICGEFPTIGAAFYHSAVNYTTLGYGDRDVVMSGTWRLLAPLEAVDGMLMFGVSTGMIFTVIQRLVQARFQDLRA